MKKLTSRIVITGANGFIARNLRRFLNEKKIATICIARRNFRNYKSEIKIISTEFSHIPISKLKNSNSLIHLIGIGKETLENSYQSTNIELTEKIIRLCKKAKIKKIIYNSGLGVSKETTSSYFISKLKAEQLIVNSGLDYTIFRPSYILGTDDLLSQNLKKQIKKGSIIIPGSGNYKLQPISVNDVVKIILGNKLHEFFKKICSKVYDHMKEQSENKVVLEVVLFDFDGSVLSRYPEK